MRKSNLSQWLEKIKQNKKMTYEATCHGAEEKWAEEIIFSLRGSYIQVAIVASSCDLKDASLCVTLPYLSIAPENDRHRESVPLYKRIRSELFAVPVLPMRRSYHRKTKLSYEHLYLATVKRPDKENIIVSC